MILENNFLMFENFKFKKLSKEQIIISVDRLTRFKPTEEKYLRVFSDIILHNLIEPKIKKSELSTTDYAQIRDIAVKIFNDSLDSALFDFSINELLKNYENAVFINNDETQKLLDNKLDYFNAIKLIKNPDALNLKWLISLCDKSTKPNISPIKKVVIAEGITEEILLPAFSNTGGYNFTQNGVKIIAAGGKNQVVKLYYKLAEQVKIPIFVLLDNDAQSNKVSIKTKLRPQDKIHLLNCGEFEDLLPKKLIKKTINNEFKNFTSIKVADLNSDSSMVKTLEKLFKEKCFHEFKKAEFAQRIKEQIKSKTELSTELVSIIHEIENF